MLDEQRIHGDPVLRIDGRGQGLLGLFGRPRAYDAQPVRDAMDVGVDGDRRDAVSEDEHAVRRLRADVGQARELLVRPGHGSGEPVEDLPRDGAQRAGLRVVEAGPADEPLDGRSRSRGERGRVRKTGEQLSARHVGRFVPGPLGEDRADQDLERVLGVVPQVRHPPIPGPVERRQAVEQGFPVERGVAHAAVRSDVAATSGIGPTPGSERSGSSPPLGRISSPTR